MMSFWIKLKNWIFHSGIVSQRFDPNDEFNQLKYLLFGRYGNFELHDVELLKTAEEKLNAGCVIVGGHAYDGECELDCFTAFNLFVRQNDENAKDFPSEPNGMQWFDFLTEDETRLWSQWLTHEYNEGILLIGREEQLQ